MEPTVHVMIEKLLLLCLTFLITFSFYGVLEQLNVFDVFRKVRGIVHALEVHSRLEVTFLYVVLLTFEYKLD